ncbi:hypothetical protein OEZ85_003157 [Tetradesmus obliquus]|uniref:Cytochrome b561 domain-containing protein n=1 Tax=Tetradesmus obliquus TaxID=3088 RepID=A0ABY8TZS5_TETOB|nr:hypothetical protein OEZ85_003157 [Tetradesmus obliquus]
MYLHGHSKASSCYDHPTKPIAGHLPPVNDPSIAIAVTLDGKPVTGLCPGETYDFRVQFPAPRAALVTVSQGTISQSNVPRCANVFTSPEEQLVKSVQASWKVTCSMLGGVEIKVTSGVSSSGKLLKGQLGLPVLRLSQCPNNNSESKLGYQCSKEVEKGVVLHYSLGGEQPSNACTQKSAYERLGGASKGSMMHFALESDLQGYLGLGFPTNPGSMVPADAVIATIDDKTATTSVGSYRLTAPTTAGVKPSDGWATGLGAVRQFNLTRNSQTTTLCFSRPVSSAAALTSSINPAVVPLIWSSSTSNAFTKHKMQGSLIVNLISGKYSDVSSASGNSAAQIAHGALMLVAFCALMPAGMLLARHKWLFGDSEAGRLPNTWRHLHQLLQLLAVLCVIASFGLAMVLFFSENGTGSGIHKLYTPHFGLGVAAVAVSVLQLAGGFMNPGVGHSALPMWRVGHYSLGWVAMILGIVNCFLGVLLMHDLKNAALVAWLTPICVLLGLMALAGLVLEVPKRTLERKGRYNARTLSYRRQVPHGDDKAPRSPTAVEAQPQQQQPEP